MESPHVDISIHIETNSFGVTATLLMDSCHRHAANKDVQFPWFYLPDGQLKTSWLHDA